ncbi:MAG: hypothetical protein KatS3mg018_0146 [Fimbriimonadales bacterium]|nr:MAG: hypothetical protein KatS3mg018_0146 [Fimbriimonadales bacterium]
MSDRSKWVNWLVSRFEIDPDAAEDLVQESLVHFTEIYRRDYPNASETDIEAHLENLSDALVCHSLCWRFQNQCRKRKREAHAYERWMTCCVSEEDPEQIALEHLEFEALLAQIPDNAREVVQLWLEGYSWQEIAERLSINVGAAKMRFQRGIERVCEHLRSQCDDPVVCGVNLSGECSGASQ